jgi:hypothetical protein
LQFFTSSMGPHALPPWAGWTTSARVRTITPPAHGWLHVEYFVHSDSLQSTAGLLSCWLVGAGVGACVFEQTFLYMSWYAKKRAWSPSSKAPPKYSHWVGWPGSRLSWKPVH